MKINPSTKSVNSINQSIIFLEPLVLALRTAFVRILGLKKNLNASRPYEHSPVRGGGNVKTFS